MPSNLHFCDPLTGEAYDAQWIDESIYRDVQKSDNYRVVCEITQFGIWGSKSIIVVREMTLGHDLAYLLETFDEKPRPKRRAKRVD